MLQLTVDILFRTNLWNGHCGEILEKGKELTVISFAENIIQFHTQEIEK